MADFDQDRVRGLYRKWFAGRQDGSSEKGGKHERCATFVLDLDHDPHAVPAIMAYADSCNGEYPFLAQDLLGMVRTALAKQTAAKGLKRRGGR